jgi:hypothetical protein
VAAASTSFEVVLGVSSFFLTSAKEWFLHTQAHEIAHPMQTDLKATDCVVVDGYYAVYVWIGSCARQIDMKAALGAGKVFASVQWSQRILFVIGTDHGNKPRASVTAKMTIAHAEQDYCELVGTSEAERKRYGFQSRLVNSGDEPLEFQALFPGWCHEMAKVQPAVGAAPRPIHSHPGCYLISRTSVNNNGFSRRRTRMLRRL